MWTFITLSGLLLSSPARADAGLQDGLCEAMEETPFDPAAAREWLEAGADLHGSCRKRSKTYKKLIARVPIVGDFVPNKTRTVSSSSAPLQIFLRANTPEALEQHLPFLIASGARVDTMLDRWADAREAEVLIRAGANPRLFSIEGEKDRALVERLVAAGVDPKTISLKPAYNAFGRPLDARQIEELSWRVALGADIGQVKLDDWAKEREIDSLRVLVGLGADPGGISLGYWIGDGDIEGLEALAALGVPRRVSSHYLWDVDDAFLRWLLEWGLDPNERFGPSDCVWFLSRPERRENLLVLLEHDLDPADCVAAAAGAADWALLDTLLAKTPADVDRTPRSQSYEITALGHAIEAGQRGAIERLIALGADLDRPAHRRTGERDRERDYDLEGGYLHQALRLGDLETARRLIEGGISTALTDADGRTVLWLAIEGEQIEAARLLAGASDLDHITRIAQSPFDDDAEGYLHRAVRTGNLDLVVALVEGGCDLRLRDSARRRPRRLARRLGHDEIAAYLREQR